MRMKLFFIGLWSLIYLTPALCMAETAYVTDSFDITFRRGPSLEHKILKIIYSGQPLQVLEKKEGWSRVQIINKDNTSLEGWVLNRYLITRIPWEAQAQKLQVENDFLKNELNLLKEKTQNEATSTLKLVEAYQKNLAELTSIKQEYAAFKQEAGEFIQLKQNFEKIRSNEQRLTLELQQLENSKRNKWFALGALVLLFGIIIGLQVGKQGKRGRSTFML